MRRSGVEIGVGLFVLLGLLAFAVMAFQVSGLSPTQHQATYTLKARFNNAAGLAERAQVTTAGVVIGRVTDIHLDPLSYKALVTMEVRQSVDYITTDSIAAIRTAGILGEKYVAISIGGAPEMLGDGDEITDTASAVVLEELIGKAMSALGSG